MRDIGDAADQANGNLADNQQIDRTQHDADEQRIDERQIVLEQQRAGRRPWIMKAPRMMAVMMSPGMPSAKRDQRGAGNAVIAAFGRRHPSISPLPNVSGVFVPFASE